MNAENEVWPETFIEQHVTHTSEFEGKFIVVENVPVRVCGNRGTFFSPKTVGQLQRAIWGQKDPVRILETPVFEFAAS